MATSDVALPNRCAASGALLLAVTGWLGGLRVAVAMATAEIGVRECRDVRSPRVESW